MPQTHNFSLASIVVLGSFNPVILTPEWFRSFKILPEQEIAYTERPTTTQKITENLPKGLKELELEFGRGFKVTPNLTHVPFQSYVLEVNPTKFIFQTEFLEKSNSLSDVVKRIFLLLIHSPITAVGFNFKYSIPFNGKKLEDVLFCDSPKINAKLKDGYLLNGALRQKNEDRTLTIKFDYDENVPETFFMDFNFHRVLPQGASEPGKLLTRIITDKFDSDHKETQKIIEAYK